MHVSEVSEILLYFLFVYIYVCVCACVCLVRDMPSPLDDKQTDPSGPGSFAQNQWHSLHSGQQIFRNYRRQVHHPVSLCHFTQPVEDGRI